jgi:hypothetical protein
MPALEAFKDPRFLGFRTIHNAKGEHPDLARWTAGALDRQKLGIRLSHGAQPAAGE